MDKALHRGLLAIALLTLSGCQRIAGPEARINAALPLDAPASAALQALQADAQRLSSDPGALQGQLQDRLKMRALECANGYAPRWWHDEARIRQTLDDSACLSRADATLAQWLGLRHAGLLLAAPALRPVPARPVDYLAAQTRISEASFARQAGIAVLHTRRQHEVFDLGSGQRLQQIPRTDSSVIFDISDNGRLLSLRQDQAVELIDLEHGRPLARLDGDSNTPAFFAGQAGIIQRQHDDSAPLLLDLSNGQQIRLPVSMPSLGMVTPTPQPGHYALLGSNRHAIIALSAQTHGWQARLIKEVDSPITIGRWPRGNLAADGASYLGLQNGPAWLDLRSLEVQQPRLAPLQVSLATPTADPDGSYLFAHTPAENGRQSFALLYSRAKHTVAPIQLSRRLSSTLRWIAPIQRNALIDDFKLTVLAALQTSQPAQSPAGFVATLPVTAAATMAGGNRDPWTLGNPAAAAHAAAGGPDPALAALASTAVIEAVGVYEGQGARHAAGHSERTPGSVQVMVKRGKPVILVLSAYEPVNWIIQPEPGARVLAVLHGGYYPGNIYGADTARSHQLGRIYTYQRNGAQYNALDSAVRQLTGKGINRFQGSYQGSHFRVGE